MIEELLSDEQVLDEINMLSTNAMEHMSNKFRMSTEILELKKIESMDFDDNLNLNILIDKILISVQNVKIRLTQLLDAQRVQSVQHLNQYFDQLMKQLAKYKKTLLLRQSQWSSLVFVMESRSKDNFIQLYRQNFQELGKFIIEVDKLNHKINVFVLEEQIQTQIQFLQEYADMIDLLKLNIVHKKYLGDLEGLKKVANKLKSINSKIVTIAQIFPYACILPEEDLFSQKKTSKRWQYLLESYVRYKIYGDKMKVRNSFETLKGSLNLVNATMSILHQTKKLSLADGKSWGKLLTSTNKIFKCAIFKQDAHHQAQLLISDPDGGLAKEIWNLPEHKMLRSVVSTAFPSIQYSKQIYIPRIFQQYLKIKGKGHLPQFVLPNPEQYSKELFMAKQYEERIPMRINCPFTIRNRFAKENFSSKMMKSVTSWFKTQPQPPEAVIYHIHGGGFISMSSFAHQTYLRTWAINLKVPIVSVDYGKAPEHPYPNGLHDCFEGYLWTLYIFRQIFDVEPRKVILVGDSAGGNLVAALTNLLIQMKLQKPDGIVLVYPALNLNYNDYTPSLMTALNDMILPHTFLKICLSAYIQGDQNPGKDYLLSPIQTPDWILDQYPPTEIYVGSKDPFHDDCCRLTQKINKRKKGNAVLTIFEEFPHGFLQFDIKTQPHEECRKATKMVEEAIQRLMQ